MAVLIYGAEPIEGKPGLFRLGDVTIRADGTPWEEEAGMCGTCLGSGFMKERPMISQGPWHHVVIVCPDKRGRHYGERPIAEHPRVDPVEVGRNMRFAGMRPA